MKHLLLFCIRPVVLLTGCLVMVCLSDALAQTQSDNNSIGVITNQMFDPRSSSMAGTTIADVHGITAIGINPALSGLMNQSLFVQLNSSHLLNSNLMRQQLILPTLTIGLHSFTASIGLIHGGPEGFPGVSSTPLSEPDIITYRGEIAYAIALGDHFSLGTLQSLSYTTANDNAIEELNYVSDLGLVYAPDGHVSYAVVFRGLGSDTIYEILETGETTLSNRLTTQVLEVGASLHYPVSEDTYVAVSFTNEKRFDQSGLWYKGGLELSPIPFLEIRGGAMVNFDQALFIPRAGLGFTTGGFHFDYMIAPKNITGEHFHQVGLTIEL